ncbi:MAG TPA: efflux RND transporter periplasmic adaptor subunit [Planctomycetota bacterium]|nr:efflux RND transporter periplasmic adaptor subunit [Planctomycetota bacterium]
MRSTRTWLIAVPLAWLAASVPGCGGGGAAAAAPRQDAGTPVALGKVKVMPVEREVKVVGTLWADEDTTISAKVSGRVGKIYKDVGDRVQSGEPLAQLITTDYLLARSQKALAVRETLARIGLTQFPKEGEFDAERVPAVLRAAQQSQNAKARFERGKALFEQQPPRISEEEFDDLRTAWEVAQSQHQVEILSASSTLDEARTRQAELGIADQMLFDTTIRAPFSAPQIAMDGRPENATASPPGREYRVAARQVSEGEFVREGTPVFRLVDDRQVKLRARVPQRFASEIREGQQARLFSDAGGEDAWGTVTRINPQVDPANRTFEVEVLVPNPERRLKAGAFATAGVRTREDPAVAFVPQESVVSFAGISKIYMVKDGAAVERIVTLGEQRDGDWVEIASPPLAADDQVVVAGTSKLADGIRVEVKPLDVVAGEPEGS